MDEWEKNLIRDTENSAEKVDAANDQFFEGLKQELKTDGEKAVIRIDKNLRKNLYNGARKSLAEFALRLHADDMTKTDKDRLEEKSDKRWRLESWVSVGAVVISILSLVIAILSLIVSLNK